MVIILDKHVLWCCNFIEVHIHVFIVVWNLIWSLWSQHKIFSIPQNFGSVRVETFKFRVNAKLFRSGENIIESVRGRGHKICYFSVRSGSGQKITGQCRFGVPKTLPRRTLIWAYHDSWWTRVPECFRFSQIGTILELPILPWGYLIKKDTQVFQQFIATSCIIS